MYMVYIQYICSSKVSFHCTLGVKIGTGSWCFPPINSLLAVVLLGISAGMFGIIILLKSMTSRTITRTRPTSRMCVASCCHDTSENDESGTSCKCHINLGWIWFLWNRLSFLMILLDNYPVALCICLSKQHCQMQIFLHQISLHHSNLFSLLASLIMAQCLTNPPQPTPALLNSRDGLV